jgi:hypothetical protein
MTASSRQISPQSPAPLSEPADAIGDQLTPNQVPPLTGYNLFLSDRTLAQAVEREGAGWAREQITELGGLSSFMAQPDADIRREPAALPALGSSATRRSRGACGADDADGAK